MDLRQSKIKAVTFDLWETLLFEKDGWNLRRTKTRCNNLTQVLNRFGFKISSKQIGFAFKELTLWLESVWIRNREVTHLDQVRFIVKKASKGSIAVRGDLSSELSLAYVSAIFEVPPYLNPAAPKVLEQLKDQKKLIGLICNTGLTPGFGLRKFLTRENVGKYFDLMIFSDEIGIRKPDPGIFEMTAQRLRVKPHQIVHIGDRLKGDVWGSKNAGFKAIYLSTKIGRDRIAESDPASLIFISRKLNGLKKGQIVPDKTITSLAMVIEAIEDLDRDTNATY